jgi:hypothetical protein
LNKVEATAATVAVSAGNQRLPPSRGRTQTTWANATATFDFVSGLLVVLPVFGKNPL